MSDQPEMASGVWQAGGGAVGAGGVGGAGGTAPVRRPDPGTRSIALLCAVVLTAAVVAVAVIQQMSVASGGRAQAARTEAASGVITPPGHDVQDVLLRLAIRLGGQPGVREPVLGQLLTQEQEPEPLLRLRAEMVRCQDQAGTDAARANLASLVDRLTEQGPPERGDAAVLEEVQRVLAVLGGDAGGDATDVLRAHHGVYAEPVILAGKGDFSPAAWESLHGRGPALTALLVGFGLLVGLAMALGLALGVTAVVLVATRTIRFAHVPPAPGGSLGLEVATAFVLGFLCLKAVAVILAGVLGGSVSGTTLMVIVMGCQWTLLGVYLYPRLRGYAAGESARTLGLHRGAGVVREVAAGVVGYVACLPLLLGGVLVSLVLMLLQTLVQRAMTPMGAAPPAAEPPSNPLFELVGGGNVWSAMMLFALATVWAPLVEELVFRGGLFRHLRARLHWVAAGVLSEVVFGVMHGYPLLMLGPVISLGLGFAILREWRGSLIAPIVAHALHNGTVMAFLITLVSLL